MSGKRFNLRSSRNKAQRNEKEDSKLIDMDNSVTEDEDIFVPTNSKPTDSLDYSIADEDEEIFVPTILKPTELFGEKDVSGHLLYALKTNRKSKMKEKEDLAKSYSRMRISEKHEIKSKERELKIIIEKLNINDGKGMYKIKTNNSSPTLNDSNTDQETESEEEVVSEEEYIADENDDDDSSDMESEGETEEDEENEDECDYDDEDGGITDNKRNDKIPVKKRELINCKTVTPNVFSTYNIKSSQYFDTQGMKNKTSNHTLSRLKKSSLKPEQIKKMIASQNYLSKEHINALNILNEKYRDAFPMWEFIMEEGFNILLYGLGSKRNIILDFQNEMVSEHPNIIVNGYFPSLTLREITDSIIVDLLEMDPITDVNECYDIINKTMLENPNDRLYLFIHNIDGPTLLSDKIQDFLSRLAAIPNIHMIASIDHTNAPLLWDNVKRSRFNFYWWDTTTFLPYQEETSYESSLLVQHSGVLVLSSLQNVFKSLTPNAKNIYIGLVKYQLEHGNVQHYEGMSFNQLYHTAREKFWVSSDVALRALLVEFLDHKLIRQKRNAEGTEFLKIPLNKEVLEQFLQDEEEV